MKTSFRNSSLLVLICILWGLAFVAIKRALPLIDPVFLAALRLWIAAFVALVWVRLQQGPMIPKTSDWGRVGALAIVNGAVLHILLIVGIDRLGAGLGAVLLYTYPLIAALLGAFYLGEEMTSRRIAGLAIGFMGVVFVTGSAVGTALGTSSMLGASASWAMGTLLFKKMVDRNDPMTLTLWTMLGGALVASLFGVAVEATPSVQLSWTLIWIVFYAAVPGMAVPWILWFRLLQRSDIGVASAYLFLTPVFALAFAAIFLAERVTLTRLVGACLVCGGVYLVGSSQDPGSTRGPYTAHMPADPSP